MVGIVFSRNIENDTYTKINTLIKIKFVISEKIIPSRDTITKLHCTCCVHTDYSYIPISHQKTLTNIKSNGTFLSKSPSLYCTETL